MVEYYRTHRMRVIVVSALVIVAAFGGVLILARPALADEQPYSETTMGNGDTSVTWTVCRVEGIKDTVPAGGALTFYWTSSNGNPHEGYETFGYNNLEGGTSKTFWFSAPDDETVTDWSQRVYKGAGQGSDTHAGNVCHNSPWALRPLSEITEHYRIPDFAPVGGTGTIIYAAVNLGEYVAENANGPCGGDWAIGDELLNDLGLTIINGRIAGLSGIYFATCPFVLDPDSETGWVPAAGSAGWLNSDSYMSTYGGVIAVISEHVYTTIPE